MFHCLLKRDLPVGSALETMLDATALPRIVDNQLMTQLELQHSTRSHRLKITSNQCAIQTVSVADFSFEPQVWPGKHSMNGQKAQLDKLTSPAALCRHYWSACLLSRSSV